MQQNIIYEIKNEDEFDFFKENAYMCVIDFSATWCKPCKLLSNKLISYFSSNKMDNIYLFDNYPLKNEINNKIVFIKVDVNKFENLSMIYKVSNLPCIIFYKCGELQQEKILGFNENEIIDNILKIIT